jgi:hypothetical protein
MASAKENTPETAAYLTVTHYRDRLIPIEIRPLGGTMLAARHSQSMPYCPFDILRNIPAIPTQYESN